jgi:transposase InsO family protein
MFRLFIEQPNEAWFADHKESSVWVIHPATGEAVKAWLSSVVDGCSRALLACIATAGRPTKEDVRTMLFRAISQTDGWPVGGRPFVLTWDNDTTFTADDVSDLLEEVGISPENTDAYAPTQNG